MQRTYFLKFLTNFCFLDVENEYKQINARLLIENLHEIHETQRKLDVNPSGVQTRTSPHRGLC